eukprot:TRINITY_DN3680_c0_g2_i1.p1 TRINITY_DN3680_c0_g2~~TRINITY_DN3680_c0_g2_i1.p1  ORF type:complete len:186 (-),score=55.40 TRINITY_DN3680_c0_g2_i1:49-606(-)
MAIASEAFGKVDILVNNAGIQHINRIEDFPTESWDRVIAVNLSSAFHLTKLAIPLMQDYGRIINISSVHGVVASQNKSAYVASKHGLNGLTKVVALENADKGITCNAICPGWVYTPLLDNQIRIKMEEFGVDFEEAKEMLVGEKEPSKDFTSCEAVADMALLLATEPGKNITGSCYTMDGGWTAR